MEGSKPSTDTKANHTDGASSCRIQLQTSPSPTPGGSDHVVLWWTECEQKPVRKLDVTSGHADVTSGHAEDPLPLSVTDTNSAVVGEQVDCVGEISDVVVDDPDAVVLHVGTGAQRKKMTCKKSQMAAISPVFSVMFQGSWAESQGDVEILDLEPQAMEYLIRYASEDLGDLPLAKKDLDTAWGVLKAADKYHVFPVVIRSLDILVKNVRTWKEAQTIFQTAYHVDMEGCHKVCSELVTHFSRQLFSDRAILALICFNCKVTVVKLEAAKVKSFTEARKIMIDHARHVDSAWCHKVCPELVSRFSWKVLDDHTTFSMLCSDCKMQVFRELLQDSALLWNGARRVIYKASDTYRDACHDVYPQLRQEFTTKMLTDSKTCASQCRKCMLGLLQEAKWKHKRYQLVRAASWWASATGSGGQGGSETGSTAVGQSVLTEAGILQPMPWAFEGCLHAIRCCAGVGCLVFILIICGFLFIHFIISVA